LIRVTNKFLKMATLFSGIVSRGLDGIRFMRATLGHCSRNFIIVLLLIMRFFFSITHTIFGLLATSLESVNIS
jgi:hypothetical protein